MFGKKKDSAKDSVAAVPAVKEEPSYLPVGVAGAFEHVTENVFHISAALYFGKHTRINTKNEKNEVQVRAFWNACREDGTLEALRAIARPGAKGFSAACTNFKGREYDYWIAIEVAPDAELPEGYEQIDVPVRQCAVFPCTGPAHEAIAKQWSYIYSTWLPKASFAYDAAPGAEIENYPFGDMDAADYQCEILVPVKPMDPSRGLPQRRDNMLAVLFVSVGAVGGMLLAGSGENALLYILVGGALGYFIYAYIAKRREDLRKKREEDEGN